MLKLCAGAVDTTCEQAARPDPTVPRCRAQSPQVAFMPAAGGDSTRAAERGRLRHPEGGPERARMKKRVITLLLAAGLLAVAALTALTFPALAQTQTVYVRLADGEVVPVTVDVPPGASLDDIQLPGTPVPAPARTHADRRRPRPPFRSAPEPPPTTAPAPAPGGGGARAPTADRRRSNSSSGRSVQNKSDRTRELAGDVKARAKDEISKAKRRGRRSPLRNPDGIRRRRSNPELHRRAPRPLHRHRGAQLHHPQVPRAALPALHLPGRRASSTASAGRSSRRSTRSRPTTAATSTCPPPARSAGCSSCPPPGRCTGSTPTRTARKDPYNPVDAIFAAARYLKAAGYEQDVRRAIFAYNHADWYVDSVLLRARLIAGVPADLIGSLTGLTEGRFPVFARARYADDIAEQQLLEEGQAGRERRPARGVERLAPQHRHLRQEGRAGRRRERRRHQEDRQEQEARPLHRAPGRLREPLHVRAPRLGLEAATRCRRPTTPSRPDQQRPRAAPPTSRPEARRARVGRPPARRRPTSGRGADRGGDVPAAQAQASAPVKERLFAHPDLPGRARGRRPRAAARRRGSQATASSRPSRPTSRGPSASTRRRSGSARSRRART